MSGRGNEFQRFVANRIIDYAYGQDKEKLAMIERVIEKKLGGDGGNLRYPSLLFTCCLRCKSLVETTADLYQCESCKLSFYCRWCAESVTLQRCTGCGYVLCDTCFTSCQVDKCTFQTCGKCTIVCEACNLSYCPLQMIQCDDCPRADLCPHCSQHWCHVKGAFVGQLQPSSNSNPKKKKKSRLSSPGRKRVIGGIKVPHRFVPKKKE